MIWILFALLCIYCPTVISERKETLPALLSTTTERAEPVEKHPVLGNYLWMNIFRRPYVRLLSQFSSVQSLSCVQLFVTPGTAAHQASLSITNSRSYSNSCPSSRWYHPTISYSVIPFSSCPQSLPASGSFQISQLLASGGQSIGVSVSASVLPMNTQDWSPFEWTGWISLQSKGLSRVFSNTTVQKHPFFGAQLSSQSNSHM